MAVVLQHYYRQHEQKIAFALFFFSFTSILNILGLVSTHLTLNYTQRQHSSYGIGKCDGIWVRATTTHNTNSAQPSVLRSISFSFFFGTMAAPVKLFSPPPRQSSFLSHVLNHRCYWSFRSNFVNTTIWGESLSLVLQTCNFPYLFLDCGSTRN